MGMGEPEQKTGSVFNVEQKVSLVYKSACDTQNQITDPKIGLDNGSTEPVPQSFPTSQSRVTLLTLGSTERHPVLSSRIIPPSVPGNQISGHDDRRESGREREREKERERERERESGETNASRES